MKLRILGIALLTASLTVGAFAAPASAIDSEIITISGHVTNADGKPLKNVRVDSDCGCDTDINQLPQASGHDVTDKSGFYSYRVQRIVAKNTNAIDRLKRYLPGFFADADATRTAAGYTIDFELEHPAAIEGTVLTSAGMPASGVTVQLYDARTGKREFYGNDTTDTAGVYSIRTYEPGRYLVRVKASATTDQLWYGGTSDADAAAIRLREGTTTSLDLVVTQR